MKLKILLGLITFSQVVYAQTNTQKPIDVTPKSPNVYAMEKYGNYEVNMFHGVPKIDISIFEIKTKKLSIPITLSYHASGIKVTDIASWVGLGWSLNVGGSISRKVKGKVDEGRFLALNPVKIKKPEEINPNTQEGYYYLRSVADGYNDSGSDIFTYSMPGKFGNFLFKDKDSEATLIPVEPIKVNRMVDPVFSGEFSFKLLDEVGTNYLFGSSLSGESVMELSSNTQGGTTSSYTGSWLLTDMLSADKLDTISFKYQPSQNLTLLNETNDYVTITDNITSVSTTCNMSSEISSSYTNSSYTVSQRLIKEILFDNGKVEFLQTGHNRNDLNSNALDRINIYAKTKNSYELLKSVKFYYSYFIGLTDSRLKLDSLSVKSADELEAQVYRFDYNTDVKLPELNSKSKDHWGYFNGKDNTTLIPQTMVKYYTAGNGTMVQIGGADRNPNPEKVQAGILKRIQYPTGGFSVFEYEPNKYSGIKELVDGVYKNKELLGGGLRVKYIYSYSNNSEIPIVKSYVYGTSDEKESGLGILNSMKQFSYSEKKSNTVTFVSSSNKLIAQCRYQTRSYSSNPTLSINDYDEANVNYPFVTEFIGTGGRNIGKKTYSFTMANDLILTPNDDEKFEVESFHWKRGKLENLKEFENLGSSNYKLKRETINYYDIINPLKVSNTGLSISQNNYVTNVPEDFFYSGQIYPYSYQFYDLYTGAFLPTNSINRNYDGEVVLETSIKTDYNDYLQPKTIKSTKSDGYSKLVNYKYAGDYQINPISEEARGVNNLLNLNIVSVPIETTSSIESPLGDIKISEGVIKTFYNNKPLVKDEFYLENDHSISNFQSSLIDGNGNFVFSPQYKKRINYSYYDLSYNLKDINVEPGKKKAFIWGYDGTSIISEVENAESSQIAYSSFEDQVKGAWNYSEYAIRESIDKCISGKYVFDFALSNQISSNNLTAGKYTVSYWAKKACSVNGLIPDEVGSPNSNGWILYTHYLNISDQGVIIISSSDAIIDELRLYPSLSYMSTYTYFPQIGLSSVTDAKNYTKYYEYDGLQRLKQIKDKDGFILKNFKYNFSNFKRLGELPKYFYNKSISANYTKTACDPNTYGTVVPYTVPDGAYYSTTSEQDAQNKASEDLLANGQVYANRFGECRPKDEVVWEPLNSYCQIVHTNLFDETISGYSLMVESAPNTTNITNVTITRSNDTNRSIVKYELYFSGGNTIKGSMSFSPGETHQ